MATIHCKACGTSYHYEKEGCCPNCGAYNRPPKRERVNADGTVQHMTQADYERRQHAQGKVCFEEKECHEEKVCYEDQARQGGQRRASQGSIYASPQRPMSGSTARPAGAAPKPTGPVPHSKFPEKTYAPVQQPQQAQNKSNPLGCLVTFIIVSVLIGAVATVAMTVLSTLGMR